MIVPLGESEAHEAGRLLGKARMADVVDAVVVTVALRNKAVILTSGMDDNRTAREGRCLRTNWFARSTPTFNCCLEPPVVVDDRLAQLERCSTGPQRLRTLFSARPAGGGCRRKVLQHSVADVGGGVDPDFASAS